jgi:hypothetical protein
MDGFQDSRCKTQINERQISKKRKSVSKLGIEFEIYLDFASSHFNSSLMTPASSGFEPLHSSQNY